MIFDVLNPEKIWHQQLVHLPTSPVYCIHFTLGNPKSHFKQYHSYMHILQILFVIPEKTNCYPFTHHTWKMPPHYLVKCTAFSSDWRYVAFLQTLVLWKKLVVGWHWYLWKEPVVMCGKWNVRQAMLQQMFKVTTFCTDTCLQSFSPLINCIVHHALLKFSPCRNKTLPQLVRIADWYTIQVKKWKRWKIYEFYKVVWWHFSGVMGKGVTVCFLLR